jgi:hypothetical protein
MPMERRNPGGHVKVIEPVAQSPSLLAIAGFRVVKRRTEGAKK